MKRFEMIKGARKLVDECADVKADEQVIIVTDTNKLDIAESVACAAYEREAETVINIMTPRTYPGEEPPGTIASAMKEADVVFMPTTYSLSHTQARIEACKAGARVVSMVDYTCNMMIKGALIVDYLRQKPIVENVAEKLTKAKDAKITTSAGTQVTMKIEGRRGFANTGVCHERGSVGSPPCIEALISPVEGTGEGVVVVDGVIVPDIGLIKEHIKLIIKDGRIIDIQGGSQANEFKELLKDFKHQNVYHIAELGIGLNPLAKLTGLRPSEDEAVFGTVHIGFGESRFLGGNVEAPAHVDAVIREPTLYLDGKIILKGCELNL